MPTIYLISANPFPTKPLKIDVEQRAILHRVPSSWDIKPGPAARLGDIIDDLRRYKPDIVHFSAHGSPTERLVLLDDNNKGVEISRKTIEALFNVMKENIRLVVLNACYLRTQAELIAESIECVVGVSRTLADENAIKYAEQFYAALAAGRSIKQAHQEAGIILTDVLPDNKPDLLVKAGIDPATVLIVGTRPERQHQEIPERERIQVSIHSEAKKDEFEKAQVRNGVSADRFTMLKIGSPDGSYVLSCEIEGLCSEKDNIESMTWRFSTDGGLVMAPLPDEAAINDGISWVTERDPPPASYDEVVKNLGTLRGKFVFDPSVKPKGKRSFAWTMQVLNGDALTAWEFYKLYSEELQKHVNKKPRGPKPSEYFAFLTWFPMRKMELGVRLPASQLSPPQLRYFELKSGAARDMPEEQILANGELRTGPNYSSDWGRHKAKWERNTGIERLEKVMTGSSGETELTIEYPLLGSYYSLDWTLPDPALPPELERLSAETATVSAALLENKKARYPGPGTERSRRIHELFIVVHQVIRDFLEANEPSFATTLMTWNHEKRRMVVVELCRNDGQENLSEWDFWVPFGLGLAGMCFRSATGAFRYKRDLDHGTQDRPENYLPVPGAEPHAFLLSLPIDHPEMTTDLAKLPDVQRCRQLVGVLSIGSRTPASRLREYCRDTLSDDEFARLRNLRDACQLKFDVLSNSLLESEGVGRGSTRTERAQAKAEAGTADGGIIHQPGLGWISPISKNRFRHKVAAFDFDGTLLRGDKFVFSWELVWKTLGFGKPIQNELKREYRRSAGDGASRADRIKAYAQWCERAVEHFKKRGLTREQIRALTKSLHLTKNCREALTRLRAEGVVTVIISGGISVVLEETFPDFRDYFDFVFMNQLIFSESGVVSGVKATAYDFEGKVEALDFVRVRSGATPDETVFVGDHFNDEAAMLHVKTALAYPPSDGVAESVSHETIEEDDLLAILPYVLVE